MTKKADSPNPARTAGMKPRTEDAAGAEVEADEEDPGAVEFAVDSVAGSVVVEVSVVGGEPSAEDVEDFAAEDVAVGTRLVALKEEKAAPNSKHHQKCEMKIEIVLHLVCFIVN